MEVQSECGEPPAAPPADPQPTGKINKAAFKLFGKRRTGSGMAGFFSFRNKGATSNGNSSSESGHGSAAAAAAETAAPVELVRSKTHDGLPVGPDGEADSQGRGEALGGGGGGSLEAVPVRSLSKSFSFFSFLRRGSLRTAESGGAGLARRGRGLKGLFSSMRWRRGREKASEAEGGEAAQAEEAREAEVTRADQGEDITLTLEPLPHQPSGDASDVEPALHQTQNSPDISVVSAIAMVPQHTAAVNDAGADSDPAFPYTPTDSPLHELLGPKAKAGCDGSPSIATPQLERCGAAGPPSEPSVERLCSLLFTDVTSLKSFDSLTGCGDIIADTEEEVLSGGNGGSGTSSSSSGGGGGCGTSTDEGKGRNVAPTSQGSPARRLLPSSQLTRSTFSAVTSSAPPSLPARAQVSPPQPEHVTGSGVVAYMGGGEEMASPEGVDDADMQGLWHMLPSTGDNSPALPRPHQGPTTAPTAAASTTRDHKIPQVKTLGLSKIPVVGGAGSRATAKPSAHHHTSYAARQPTSPGDKELLSDEGYWDTPTATPTATPVDEGIQRSERIVLSRDSCSGDQLYDLYNSNPDEDKEEEEDLSSTPSPSTEYKLSPSSQTTPPSSSSSPPSFRSLKGSTSLPRDSKIPLSVRQSPPPHSVSQSSLPSVLEASAPQPKTQAPPPARTRIPVSKVPVRRAGNKSGNASRGSAQRK